MKIDFRLLFLICLFPLLILSGCQDHRATSIDTFGELDSLQVAADTTMQVNMDRSYEFQKSLVENDTVVFDFLAYDKPKGSSSPDWESKFIVIRRTSSSSDTIIKDFRSGIVQSLWLSDMNQNGKPEIMFYEYPTSASKHLGHTNFYAYETDGRRNAHKIQTGFRGNVPQTSGRDSFFVYQGFLIHKVPYYTKQTDTIAAGDVWQSYRLADHALVLAKEKQVAQ